MGAIKGHRQGPRTLGAPGSVAVDEELQLRVKRFLFGRAILKAVDRLGVGQATLLAARDRGRMLRSTRDRLIAALEREEEAERAARIAS